MYRLIWGGHKRNGWVEDTHERGGLRTYNMMRAMKMDPFPLSVHRSSSCSRVTCKTDRTSSIKS